MFLCTDGAVSKVKKAEKHTLQNSRQDVDYAPKTANMTLLIAPLAVFNVAAWYVVDNAE
jgi:hypothetical protein